VKYGDISPQVAAFSVASMLKSCERALSLDLFSKPRNRPVDADPLSVTCCICEAPPGSRCRPVRRHINWISGKHIERLYDARAVAEAVAALDPKSDVTIKCGDTVTIRGNRFTVV
jgi:hypothetical protein